MKVFVVIPVYNEEKSIEKVIADVKTFTPHVVVVDDCSRDQSAAFAKHAGAVVLRHVVNRGQGAALQTGNVYALAHGADIIVHFDSDGQHQAKDIPKMIEPLVQGRVDVVFGTRFSGTEAVNMPASKKKLLLPTARLVNRVVTGLKLSDGHNGFRALSRKAVERIIIKQDRMAHNTEIPSLVARESLRYEEVPVEVIYNEYGQGVGDGVRILWELLKERIIR